MSCGRPLGAGTVTASGAPERRMRRGVFVLFLLLGPLGAARAEGRWQTLPPTPPPIVGTQSGNVQANGIQLYYAEIGQGSPVVLLHGGLANSDYFGHQVQA